MRERLARGAEGMGGTVAGARAARPVSTTPHSLQYRCPRGFAVEHSGHATVGAKFRPQSPQNAAESRFWWWQYAQSIGRSVTLR